LTGVEDSSGSVVDADIAHTVVVSAVPSSATIVPGTPPVLDLAHRLATQAVAALIDVAPADISLQSLCRQCGGAHGAMSVASPASTGASVSLSRAPGLVVAVASLLGPIGVDIESVGRMMRAPVDAVALHPAEIESLARLDPAVRDRARTLQWTRKEALLKATGFGLRISPAAIHLGGIGVAAPASEARLDGTLGTGASPVQLLDAPETLWNDLDRGWFTPVFADLSGLETQHPHADRDLVGSICVLMAAP
jgi:4'-phosphopantetheinyl transferase